MGRACRGTRRRDGRRRRSSPPAAPAAACSGGTGGKGTPWWRNARASGKSLQFLLLGSWLQSAQSVRIALKFGDRYFTSLVIWLWLDGNFYLSGYALIHSYFISTRYLFFSIFYLK